MQRCISGSGLGARSPSPIHHAHDEPLRDTASRHAPEVPRHCVHMRDCLLCVQRRHGAWPLHAHLRGRSRTGDRARSPDGHQDHGVRGHPDRPVWRPQAAGSDCSFKHCAGSWSRCQLYGETHGARGIRCPASRNIVSYDLISCLDDSRNRLIVGQVDQAAAELQVARFYPGVPERAVLRRGAGGVRRPCKDALLPRVSTVGSPEVPRRVPCDCRPQRPRVYFSVVLQR